MRLGLRSGGQLPPGSDVGLKSPVRRPRISNSTSVATISNASLVAVEAPASPVKGLFDLVLIYYLKINYFIIL